MVSTYVAQADAAQRRLFPGAYSDPIFDEHNTAVAAFSAMLNVFFSVDTYDDGIYRLGLLIEALDENGKKVVERAYYPLGDEHIFSVVSGRIQ